MEVDIDLSALDIQSRDSESPNNTLESENEVYPVRRSSRRVKVRPVENAEKLKVVTRKRKLNSNSSMREIENYYLDRRVKVFSPALETIFEEPKEDVMMGTRRLKRCINFSDVVNEKPDKAKVKRRSMKAKRLNRIKKFAKKNGLELLMSKLKDLDNDES